MPFLGRESGGEVEVTRFYGNSTGGAVGADVEPEPPVYTGGSSAPDWSAKTMPYLIG